MVTPTDNTAEFATTQEAPKGHANTRSRHAPLMSFRFFAVFVLDAPRDSFGTEGFSFGCANCQKMTRHKLDLPWVDQLLYSTHLGLLQLATCLIPCNSAIFRSANPSLTNFVLVWSLPETIPLHIWDFPSRHCK